mmetsp:Transcript_16193/g.54612  ORF Transcript_16193/g.54612 Transcript_16193/m.54612 type:complete len:377 (-) Transcript_16193:1317-2447(-)
MRRLFPAQTAFGADRFRRRLALEQVRADLRARLARRELVRRRLADELADVRGQIPRRPRVRASADGVVGRRCRGRRPEEEGEARPLLVRRSEAVVDIHVETDTLLQTPEQAHRLVLAVVARPARRRRRRGQRRRPRRRRRRRERFAAAVLRRRAAAEADAVRKVRQKRVSKSRVLDHAELHEAPVLCRSLVGVLRLFIEERDDQVHEQEDDDEDVEDHEELGDRAARRVVRGQNVPVRDFAESGAPVHPQAIQQSAVVPVAPAELDVLRRGEGHADDAHDHAKGGEMLDHVHDFQNKNRGGLPDLQILQDADPRHPVHHRQQRDVPPPEDHAVPERLAEMRSLVPGHQPSRIHLLQSRRDVGKGADEEEDIQQVPR